MSATRTSGDDVYLRNMAALWRCDPRLAYLIDQMPPDARLLLEPTRSGVPTASLALADGRRQALHSAYDPVAEAASFCKSITLQDDWTGAVVLCGLGLGYHVPPLRHRIGPEGLLIAAEPDVLTLKTALELVDLSGQLSSGRLMFLHSLDKHDLHAKLEPHAGALMLGTQFAAPPAARLLHADFHRRVRAAITEFAAFSKMSLITLMANARITCGNIANNLAAYLSTPTIESLAGRHAGQPAVIVAAGPSLGRNVQLLARDAADDPSPKPIIIALQTTLKPLLSRGIQPDYVTSLDFSDLSRRFFENVNLSGVTLVAEPKAGWQVIDAFRGGAPATHAKPPRDLRLLYNDFAHSCLGNELGRRAGLRAGSTVAHLAFYLAEYLGCDPIIFVGQDLGFSGGVYYTPGVAIHDAWQTELGPFCTLETKEWERIARMRPILQKTTDVCGQPIYTDEQMSTYREQFERDFAASPARVIDATEGGVPKSGARSMTLKAALEAFASHDNATRGIEDDNARAALPAADRAKRLHDGAAALRLRLEELAGFRALCEETRALLSEMDDCVEDAPAFNQRIVRVDELRLMVRRCERIFRMVSDVSQLAEWQKFTADRRLAADTQRAGMPLNATDRARRQLARDREFVSALLEGCTALQEILRGALVRVEDETAVHISSMSPTPIT